MKNYVVGILSMFENDLCLFRITADDEYDAVKKAMIEFYKTAEEKQYEIGWQQSNEYPSDLEGLIQAYEEIPFGVIEI